MMPLALTVLLVVLGVTAVVALVGCMIDKSAERADHEDGREGGHQA